METTQRINKARLLDRLATGRALRGPLMQAMVDDAGAGELLPPGSAVGPWIIIELLGTGGMSHVYLASRGHGEFEHMVALKVVRGNPDLILRLRHERQLIANLRHPHIVNLVDSGETEQGDLWLAMGLVEGMPIDTYAEQNVLDWRSRLGLFDAVCGAVQYAHGRGLIHRDIKPANVLIDAEGHPRLLDFGIAFEQGAESAPDRSLTPGFAAPEQLNGQPLTTVTDVFQLGLLLRRILEAGGGDPAIPAAVAADCRALIERATAIDPRNRHPAVAALREDLSALRARRPLAHQAGLTRIRWSRFVERHRLALAVGLIATLALGISLTMSALQLRNERDRALANEARAQSIARFLIDTLSTANPWSGNAAGGTVVEAMNRAAVKLDEELEQSLDVRRELRGAIATVYLMADKADRCLELLSSPAAQAEKSAATPVQRAKLELTHSECHLSLDERDSAWAKLDVADQSLAGLHDQAAEQLRAKVLVDRGQLLTLNGKLSEADKVLEDGLKLARSSGIREQEYRAKRMLGFNLMVANDNAGAVEQFEQALPMATELHGPTHRSTLTAAGGLAMALDRIGRSAEAEALLRQSIDTASGIDASGGEARIIVAELRDNLATVYFQQGRREECVAEARAALDIYRVEAAGTTRGYNPSWRVASCAYMLGQFDVAGSHAQEALHFAQMGVPVGVINAERMLAAVAARQGDTSRSAQHLERAEQALASTEVVSANVHTAVILTRALLAAKRGQLQEAREKLALVDARLQSSTPPRWLGQEYAEVSAMVATATP
ncbi:MAG: protein kinase [Lysobacterales bacterium]